MKTFENRLAVITGAGNGIGQALARKLAEKGCHLALVDINKASLQTTRAMVNHLDRRVSFSCLICLFEHF